MNMVAVHQDSRSNTLVKSYLSPKVLIRPSQIDGFGAFAQDNIRKGEVVFVKGGHIVTKDQLFYSEQISSYLPISDYLFVGATNKDEEPEIKLCVNHSCEPNCGLHGEITFVAMRDIGAGEELTFDYAMVDNEYYEIRCTCGSPSCRRMITGFDWKIEALQKKYSHYFAQYLLDKITAQEISG